MTGSREDGATRAPLRFVGLVVLLAAAGCGQARPLLGGKRACTNWKDDIQPLFQQSCASCHSGASPAGGYDATTYLASLTRSDGSTPEVQAGNAQSRLLQTLDPQTADATHQAFAKLFPKIQSWVVDCEASYFDSYVHEGGILDPANPAEFHGNLVQSLGWGFSTCQKCHGMDYKGGTSGVSCYRCHEDGPTSCTTCHGQPPATGAHLTHVEGGALGKKYDCTTCHVKPMLYTDVGHLFDDTGAVITAPAKVALEDFASATPEGFTRSGPAEWSHDTGTCRNVYCHGGVFNDENATVEAPAWNGKDQAKCGACHGLPPGDHAVGKCVLCHQQVVDANMNLVNPALHLDGIVEVGNGATDCSGCHGTPGNPAPPRDLEGDTDTTAIGVGAHQAHLLAPSGLRGPIACEDCHLVPKNVTDPGHIDHDLPATVFPDDPTFRNQSLAVADSANASWDRATATCKNTYCHGGGNDLAGDQSPNLHRQPVWTSVGTGQAACGTCHGIPPVDSHHTPTMRLLDCGNAGCHPNTMDGNGNFIWTGPPGHQTTKHMNGVVD